MQPISTYPLSILTCQQSTCSESFTSPGKSWSTKMTFSFPMPLPPSQSPWHRANHRLSALSTFQESRKSRPLPTLTLWQGQVPVHFTPITLELVPQLSLNSQPKHGRTSGTRPKTSGTCYTRLRARGALQNRVYGPRTARARSSSLPRLPRSSWRRFRHTRSTGRG